MKVVVGLGNPGPRYAGTRHNVGFDVIDYLASGPGCGRFRSQFQGLIAELNEAGQKLVLVKPETFMNLSGRCVRAVLDFYKVPVDDLLVVCDDIALPLGKLRMRAKGSHGGHNGLRDVQQHLGSDAYARLRIGVDAPPLKADDATVDHVLGRFRRSEQATIEDAIAKAARAVLVWAAQGTAACMNAVNGPAGEPAGDAKADKKTEKKPKGDAGANPPATEPKPE
jgi:PTH1 family peptidyl-tRNA hydrolase